MSVQTLLLSCWFPIHSHIHLLFLRRRVLVPHIALAEYNSQSLRCGRTQECNSYIAGLPVKTFWDPYEYAWARGLRENAKTIQDEYLWPALPPSRPKSVALTPPATRSSATASRSK